MLGQNGAIVQLDGAGKLYQQVYRALRGEILDGRLASGERIPSTRDLAGLLKVSRNTAVMAYEQLLAEGFIEARSGAAGSVVAPVLPPDGYVSRPSALQDRARPAPSRRAAPKL